MKDINTLMFHIHMYMCIYSIDLNSYFIVNLSMPAVLLYSMINQLFVYDTCPYC